MAEKPPLPPEETPITTGLANAIKFALKNAGKTNPIGTALQVIKPTELGDATLPKNFSENTLYHGTTADIKTGLKYSKEGVLGEGIYLTPNVKYAETYAEGAGGNILPVKTNIENPLIVDMKKGKDRFTQPGVKVLTELGVKEDKAFEIVEKAFEEKGNITKQISSRARKQGYDAIVLKVDGKVQEILAYNPKAITSIFKKKRGGSVMMRNPYDYNPRGI